jgi:hypothetical protein
MQHLNVSDLPIALDWVKRLPRRRSLPSEYMDLMDAIMLFAWQHFQVPAVRKAFAAAALSRVQQYDVIIGEGLSSDRSNFQFSSDLQTDIKKRRNLFVEMANLVSDLEPFASARFCTQLIMILLPDSLRSQI